jgi:hypothetical protein
VTAAAGTRYGPLFHAKHRRPGHSVENEQQAHLRNLRHGRNGLAVAGHVNQRRVRAEVIVPDVVMHKLLVPQALAGRDIQRDQ